MKSTYRARSPRRDHSSPQSDWILENYYGTLSEEITHALDQLHNATNWGLTLVAAGLVAVISRASFPDKATLYALLVLIVVNTHFAVRAMKGYINVVRFGFLQRSIARAALGTKSGRLSQGEHTRLADLVTTYHIEWHLPLRRHDVYLKSALQLGFGYVLLILSALAAYTASIAPIGAAEWWAVAVALIFALVELAFFARSPYMSNVVPAKAARSQR